jgi:type II secretion system (T2SS) protein E
VRLPELLVVHSVIDAAMVEQVLEAQAEFGGTFDTNLLEEGVVDERRLQPFLEAAYDLRNAVDVFAEPQREAIARLPRRHAETARACPVRLSEGTLDLVVADPSDVRGLDEIGLVTGHRIRVNVACEARVSMLLGRAYHIPITHRHLALMQGQLWPKRETRRRRLEDGWMPEVQGGVAAAMPSPPFAVSPPAPSPSPSMVRAPSRAAEDPIAGVSPPVVTRPSLPPLLPAVLLPRGSRPMTPVPPAAAVPAVAAPGARGYDVISAQLGTVEDVEHIPAIALGYLAPLLSRVVLLKLRRSDLQGWDARGPGLGREVVQAIGFPLDHASVFARAASGGEIHEGRLPRGFVEECFVAALGAETWPDWTHVVPVRAQQRTLAVLYGEAASRAAAEAAREPVAVTAGLVGQAFLRLILLRKRGR